MKFKAIGKLLLAICISISLMGCTAEASTTYKVPKNSSFKSFMDYGTITNKTSEQYAIQQDSITLDNGLRVYNGFYTVAVGTGFDAPAGTYIDVTLSTGVILHCIVGDIKQDAHTDATNRQVAHNGNVIEFIVDTAVLDAGVKAAGDISKISGYEGYVKNVKVYDDIPDFEEGKLIIGKYCASPLCIIEYLEDGELKSCIVSEETYNMCIVGSNLMFDISLT